MSASLFFQTRTRQKKYKEASHVCPSILFVRQEQFMAAAHSGIPLLGEMELATIVATNYWWLLGTITSKMRQKEACNRRRTTMLRTPRLRHVCSEFLGTSLIWTLLSLNSFSISKFKWTRLECISMFTVPVLSAKRGLTIGSVVCAWYSRLPSRQTWNLLQEIYLWRFKVSIFPMNWYWKY